MARRDNLKLEILNHLRKFGPTTSSQIDSLFFSENQESYRKKIVGELLKNDVVSSFPVSFLRNRSDINVPTDSLPDIKKYGTVSKLSKIPDTLAYTNLSKREHVYFISESRSSLMCDYKEKNSLKFLGHQLLVSDIKMILGKYVDNKNISSDSEFLKLNGDFSNYLGPIPDLIISKNGVNIAIEVELTTKSSKRYTKKAGEYGYSEFDLILYFCASDRVTRHLAESFRSVSNMYFSLLLAPESFFRYEETERNIGSILREYEV